MKKNVTIADIARKVGVSTATVSRVLNRTPYPVSDALRQKIEQTAQEMNYVPNLFGKRLKEGESRDIGILLPSLTNPYYSHVIGGIESVCRKKGLELLFCSSDNRVDMEKANLNRMLQMRVAGILLSSISLDTTHIDDALKINPNILLFDQPVQNAKCDCVAADFSAAGELALDYLYACGHRKIAFLSTPLNRASRIAVHQGLQQRQSALQNDPIELQTLFLGQEDCNSLDYDCGQELARRFLRQNCDATAILAINDIVALGIIRGFYQAGVRVPEDISVMGIDDIDLGEMARPPLTTVYHPSFEIGETAMNRLLDKIENGKNKTVYLKTNILAQPELIVRASVKRVSASARSH